MGLTKHLIDGWKISGAFNQISRVRRQLTEKFSVPEVSRAMRIRPSAEDTPIWRFDNVLVDKLKEKGWPIDRNADSYGFELEFLVGLLEHSDFDRGPLRTFETLRRYPCDDQYPDSIREKEATAVEFLRVHVGDLKQIARELRSFTEADLRENHRDVSAGTNKSRSYGPILPGGGTIAL